MKLDVNTSRLASGMLAIGGIVLIGMGAYFGFYGRRFCRKT